MAAGADNKGPKPQTLPIREALRLLEAVLREKPPESFLRVGGEVGLFIAGAETPDWTVRLAGEQVSIVEGKSAAPVVRIGLSRGALSALVRGTLDVPRAFAERRLAVEGDFDALRRFVDCFALGGKAGLFRG